jgi:uncharacterized membrane protein
LDVFHNELTRSLSDIDFNRKYFINLEQIHTSLFGSQQEFVLLYLIIYNYVSFDSIRTYLTLTGNSLSRTHNLHNCFNSLILLISPVIYIITQRKNNSLFHLSSVMTCTYTSINHFLTRKIKADKYLRKNKAYVLNITFIFFTSINSPIKVVDSFMTIMHLAKYNQMSNKRLNTIHHFLLYIIILSKKNETLIKHMSNISKTLKHCFEKKKSIKRIISVRSLHRNVLT